MGRTYRQSLRLSRLIRRAEHQGAKTDFAKASWSRHRVVEPMTYGLGRRLPAQGLKEEDDEMVCIRKAKIDPDLRETFERYGVVGMQVTLSVTNYIVHKGKHVLAEKVVDSLLPWLTEQYDRAERKETWSITMPLIFFIVPTAIGIIHAITQVSSVKATGPPIRTSLLLRPAHQRWQPFCPTGSA